MPDSKLWDNQVAENCRVKALWKMIVLKAAATMAAALVAASVAAPGPAQVRQKLSLCGSSDVINPFRTKDDE